MKIRRMVQLPMLCDRRTDGRMCSARNIVLISKVPNNHGLTQLIVATGCVLGCGLSQLIILKLTNSQFNGSAVCWKPVKYASCRHTYRKVICACPMLQ